MYEQTLYKVLPGYITKKTLDQGNRNKKWKYGHDKDNDMVIISKTGKIGEIYEIQNLKIALPLEENVYKRSEIKEEQFWQQFAYPKELDKLKNVFDWNKQPDHFKERWYDYIDNEFKYRDEGFFYYSNGKPTYITGTHYMYLQWSKIDVGAPDFRESNRLFFIFWEACKADPRCYGMCYLKNRRSGTCKPSNYV